MKHRAEDLRAKFGDEGYDGYMGAYNKKGATNGVAITVTQKASEPEVPTEIIAQSIAAIADAMKRINAGKLNRKALVVLLTHATKLPQSDVKQVLDSLTDLGKLYLK